MMIIMGVIGLVVVGIIASKLVDPSPTSYTHYRDTLPLETLTPTTSRLIHTQNRKDTLKIFQLCLSFEFALVYRFRFSTHRI